MAYRCIGRHKVKQHADSTAVLVQCTNESETPSNPNRPEWGYLCPSCSGEKPHGRTSAAEEIFNANGAQSDYEEFKDMAEIGFMAGMHSSKEED